MISKQCNRCSEVKEASEFTKNKLSKDGLYSLCKVCKATSTRRQKEANTIGVMLVSTRSRAKRKEIDFNISKEDLFLPSHCPILGSELIIGKGKCTANSPTIDRIDSSKGYVRGNVHVISHRANTIKSDANLEELHLVYKYMRRLL